MAYPQDKTGWVDGVTELEAWWFNALEDYLGVKGSTDPESLTYKLTNPQQVDPGHKHTATAFSGGNDADVFGRAAGAWAPMTPDAAGLVAKSGDQSIAGKKTFTNIPEGPNADPTTGNQLTRKSFVDAGIAGEANARVEADTTEANTRAAADAAQVAAIAEKVAKAGDIMVGDLGFDGEAADRAVKQGRRSTMDSAGRSLTLGAGGATIGAINKAGGILKLQPGFSTGSGESGVEVYGCPAGFPGGNDNAMALMFKVLGNKMGFFGEGPVTKPAPLTAQLTTLTCAAPGVEDYDLAAPVQNTGWGFSTADEFKTAMSVIANLQTRCFELEIRLQSLGLLGIGIIF
jgi:hypothetical protein